MRIYQREQISLVYVLTPIPEQMIQDQIRREIWQAMANPAYAGMSMEEIESKVEEDFRNEVDFDVIPEEKRVREFILKRDAVKERQLITRLTLCRAIYKEIFNQI
jgi:transcription antitermination factor NusG